MSNLYNIHEGITMKEKWKPFCGGLYEVSNLGRMYSVRYNRILRPGLNKDTGYLLVVTCVNYKRKTRYIHRLVAREFIGPRPKGKEVNHIDTDKTNNRVDNLEYVTPTVNAIHSVVNNLHPEIKLTPDKVRKIRKLYNRGWIEEELAEKFNVQPCNITSVVNKRTWYYV